MPEPQELEVGWDESGAESPDDVSERVLEPLDSSYAEVRERVLEALKTAQGAADRLRGQARAEAADILRQADEEASAHAKQLVEEGERRRAELTRDAERHHAELIAQGEARRSELISGAEHERTEAEEHARNLRLSVEAYASRHRREAEEEARQLVLKAEAQARAARETAQATLDQAEALAGRRKVELANETRALEERWRRVVDDLRDITAQHGLGEAEDGSHTNGAQPFDEAIPEPVDPRSGERAL